eukprot:jgi/Bigna1/54376/estExt_Genewise1Plus.C_320077
MERQHLEGLDRIEATRVRLRAKFMVKGRPCVCKKVDSSAPGKHGAVKCNFTAQDMLTDKKYSLICPGKDRIEVPEVHKYDLIVTSLNTDMDENMMETVNEFVTVDEDGEKVVLDYIEGAKNHDEAVEKYQELYGPQDSDDERKEVEDNDGKVVVLSILQATVKKGSKFVFEHCIDKVTLAVQKKSKKKSGGGGRRSRRRGRRR